MSGWKKALQAAAGLAAALAAAAAAGTWLFPAEKDLIAVLGPFRVSRSGIGAGLSLLTLLAFTDGWIGGAARRDPEGSGAGRVLNGLGFGLLPAAAVWKIFEHWTVFGKGAPLPGEIAPAAFFTGEGTWLPCRAELAAAVILAAAVTVWLVLRRSPLPENGDLFPVSLVLWCAVRMVTQGFRPAEAPLSGIAGWIAAGLGAAALLYWTAKAFRQKRNTGYAWACVPVYAACAAGTALIQNRVFHTGNGLADLILQVCLTLLSAKAALCMGRVTRA